MFKCTIALKKGWRVLFIVKAKKTSHLTKNPVENRLNRPLAGQQTVCQSDCQADWQTDLQAGQA
jgi:hypothetical protein